MPEDRGSGDGREPENRDIRQDFDRRLEDRRRRAREEHSNYWNRTRLALFGAFGCIILPLAAFGLVAVLFVIYAIFYAPPMP